MSNLISNLSQRKAVILLRILYPLWTVIGIFSIMYVTGTLVVPGDAATTAKNILANDFLFRTGIAGSLIVQIIHILVVLVLYKLLAPVSKSHAVLMVIFSLIGVPIAMLNELNKFAALFLLNGPDFLTVLGTDQLHAHMMFFLNLNKQGILIAGIFWGLWLLPLGYLVFKSGYFPRIFGILLTIAGVGYVLDSFTHFILPNLEILFQIFGIMLYGEVLFMLWVLLRGAKLPKA
jgi:hypothetical protein